MTTDSTRFISIMSGKGGTGKTLLTAVLGRAIAREGINVLLVDLDIFVRGLSILLYDYTKRSLNPDQMTVSEFLAAGRDKTATNWKPLSRKGFSGFAISRFFECDVLSATRDIGDALNYNDLVFTSNSYSHGFIKNLFSLLESQYEIVLLDCRAGIDSLVVTIAAESHLVISVAEDDDVCLQANTNLINHLKYLEKVKGVFTLINKGRRIVSYRDLSERMGQRMDYNYIGVIPFDQEIMEDFGKERFWNTVNETLYFRAIIDCWNHLAERNALQKISEQKYRFPPSIFMSKKSGNLSLIGRILRLNGVLLTTMALIISIIGYFEGDISSRILIIISSFTVGAMGLWLSTFNFRRFLLGKSDAPRKL